MKIKEGKIDQPEKINPDRLHEEMKARLGDKYISMDTGIPQTGEDGKSDRTKSLQVLVRLTEDATAEDTAAAEAVIAAHDPEALSTTQQKAKDRVDAFARFKAFDFKALRELKPTEQNPVIIGLLEDIQKLLQGTE
jgi:hypothetical protein